MVYNSGNMHDPDVYVGSMECVNSQFSNTEFWLRGKAGQYLVLHSLGLRQFLKFELQSSALNWNIYTGDITSFVLFLVNFFFSPVISLLTLFQLVLNFSFYALNIFFCNSNIAYTYLQFVHYSLYIVINMFTGGVWGKCVSCSICVKACHHLYLGSPWWRFRCKLAIMIYI